MSEYIHHFDNGQPYFAYHTKMGDIISTPDNTTVYMHNPEWAGVDHIFTALDYDDSEIERGVFLWRIVANELGDGLFDGVVVEMEQEGFEFVKSDIPADHDLHQFGIYLDNHVKKPTNKKIRKELLGGE